MRGERLEKRRAAGTLGLNRATGRISEGFPLNALKLCFGVYTVCWCSEIFAECVNSQLIPSHFPNKQLQSWFASSMQCHFGARHGIRQGRVLHSSGFYNSALTMLEFAFFPTASVRRIENDHQANMLPPKGHQYGAVARQAEMLRNHCDFAPSVVLLVLHMKHAECLRPTLAMASSAWARRNRQRMKASAKLCCTLLVGASGVLRNSLSPIRTKPDSSMQSRTTLQSLHR